MNFPNNMTGKLICKKSTYNSNSGITRQIELSERFQGFHDPETASTFGLSHVPSHPLIVPSSRGMPSRDSCPQADTRNLFGTSGNVF